VTCMMKYSLLQHWLKQSSFLSSYAKDTKSDLVPKSEVGILDNNEQLDETDAIAAAGGWVQRSWRIQFVQGLLMRRLVRRTWAVNDVISNT
jgi:hypothetical protein